MHGKSCVVRKYEEAQGAATRYVNRSRIKGDPFEGKVEESYFGPRRRPFIRMAGRPMMGL
jgi:hypothetical protein